MNRTIFAVLMGVVGMAHAEMATKAVLTLDTAKRMAAAAENLAKKNGTGAAIAIVDEGGHLVYLSRLDGTFAAGSSVSTGKARTSATFKKPTRVFEEAIKNGRVALTGVAEMTPLQGGVPVLVGNDVIGAVGVSGASSAPQDEEYAIVAAKAATESIGPDASVRYFDRKSVDAGFEKGAVLLNAGAYQVHTSRRTAPGKAEVHTRDTDVLHILEGEATVVTGGTVVDPQTVEPHEIRGSAIQNGQTRRVQKGDVLVVPNGVPHWFKDVKGTLLYLAVKTQGAQ